jgi:hypothetical protein
MASNDFIAEIWKLFVFDVAEKRNGQFLLPGLEFGTDLERSLPDDDVIRFELKVLIIAEDDCSFDDDGVESWWSSINDERLSCWNYDTIHISRRDIASPGSFIGEFVSVEEGLEYGCLVASDKNFEARVFGG